MLLTELSGRPRFGVCLVVWWGKRELIFLQLFTCNYVVSVRWGFLFLLVLRIGCIACVILLWHSLGHPYNNFYMEPSCWDS